MKNGIYSMIATTGLLFSAATLAAGVSFTELDANADGVIDQGEASASPVLAPLFSNADSNTDGSLDQNEFSSLVQSSQEAPQGGAASEEAE